MGVINEIQTFIEAVQELHPDFLTDCSERSDPKEERCAQKLRTVSKIDWSKVELNDRVAVLLLSGFVI